MVVYVSWLSHGMILWPNNIESWDKLNFQATRYAKSSQTSDSEFKRKVWRMIYQMIYQESLYCGRAKKKRETIEIHSYQLFTLAETYFFYIYMHCWTACVIGRLYLFPQTTPIDCYAMMRFMINRQGYQSFRKKEAWSITTWISFLYVFLYLDNIVIGLSYA